MGRPDRGRQKIESKRKCRYLSVPIVVLTSLAAYNKGDKKIQTIASIRFVTSNGDLSTPNICHTYIQND